MKKLCGFRADKHPKSKINVTTLKLKHISLKNMGTLEIEASDEDKIFATYLTD